MRTVQDVRDVSAEDLLPAGSKQEVGSGGGHPPAGTAVPHGTVVDQGRVDPHEHHEQIDPGRPVRWSTGDPVDEGDPRSGDRHDGR